MFKKLKSWFSGGKTKNEAWEGIPLNLGNFAGSTVNATTAMQHEAVWSCVRDKAESIGMLGLRMYREDSNGKPTQVRQGAGARERRIFTEKPNDFQSMQDFIEMAVAALELRGEFFALTPRNKYGNVMEIVPFYNQGACSAHIGTNGVVYYTYVTNDGQTFHKEVLDATEVMHVKLFSMNGVNGCSPISYTYKALGVSMAQEEYLGELMENGSLSKGFLSTEGEMKDKTVLARIKAQWKKNHSGVKSAGSTPILEGGMKWNNMSISPADAELISQRRFSRAQVCAIFRVPTSRIPTIDETAQTGTTVEQDNMRYLTTGLMPDIRKLETAISALMPQGMTVKFDVMQFLRGDYKTMQEVLGGTFKLGAISMNELRAGLGFEEKEGGDLHAIETNNLTFGTLEDIPRMQAENQRRAEEAHQAAINPPAPAEEKPSKEPKDEA